MARRPPAVQPRARILYADDEPQLRRLGEQVLVRSGYDVDTAADGAEAWAALLDVNRPQNATADGPGTRRAGATGWDASAHHDDLWFLQLHG